MTRSYENQLDEIASTIQPEGYQLEATTIPLALRGIEMMDERYGPESDNPRPYHDGQHEIDVIRRSVRLTNILYPFITETKRRKIYELGFAVGAWHDVVQGMVTQGADERASAKVGLAALSELDSPLNTKAFKLRFKLGVLATEAVHGADGQITQPHMRSGSHDPIKYIAASADINGIAMEGPARMLEDATNLALEVYGEKPSKEEYGHFLVNQAGFLKDRLNDDQVVGDLSYYFPPDDVESIYAQTHKAFHPNIDAAVTIARAMKSRPELQRTIAGALTLLSPEQVKSKAGSLLGHFDRVKRPD